MTDSSVRQLFLAAAIVFLLTALYIDSQVWELIVDSVRNYW